jgi:hypothetical protein
MKIDDSLSDVFNVEKIPENKVIESNVEVLPNDSIGKIEDDYEHARNNLRLLLLDGQSALQTALAVAQSSEHPRAIEVVGNLMKQLADINQQLLDLHRQKQKLDEPTNKDDAKKVTNNAIFVGSTAELNKLIKNMSKGD